MDAKKYLEELTELIRETQISTLKILDCSNLNDFQNVKRLAFEKIRTLAKFSQGHDEELKTVFQLEYINFLIDRCGADCLTLIEKIEDLDEDDIDLILCNLSTIYLVVAIQVKYNSNFVAILEIAEFNPNLSISFYDEVKNEQIEHTLSADNISFLVPVYGEKIDLTLTTLTTGNKNSVEYKRNVFFPHDILILKGNKLTSVYVGFANFCLSELTSSISDSIVDNIKESIDFSKVGLIKIVAIRRKHFDNIYFKLYLMNTLFCIKAKSNCPDNVKQYVIDKRAENIYDAFMRINTKDYWLKTNKCFENIDSFKEFFVIQYLMYENLIDNINKGEYLIPLTSCYKKHAGLKSIIAVVLADDILLDYYYCDVDFSVNFIRNQKGNLLNSPHLAISDASKVYEIIYNGLIDF